MSRKRKDPKQTGFPVHLPGYDSSLIIRLVDFPAVIPAGASISPDIVAPVKETNPGPGPVPGPGPGETSPWIGFSLAEIDSLRLNQKRLVCQT